LGATSASGSVAGVHHVGGFRQDYGASLEARRERFQTGDPPPIPRELIWIMDDPSGNPICLGITGEHRGRVYFCDHERGPDPDTWDGRVQRIRPGMTRQEVQEVLGRPDRTWMASFCASGTAQEWRQDDIGITISYLGEPPYVIRGWLRVRGEVALQLEE
jgi:hypothetical protein